MNIFMDSIKKVYGDEIYTDKYLLEAIKKINIQRKLKDLNIHGVFPKDEIFNLISTGDCKLTYSELINFEFVDYMVENNVIDKEKTKNMICLKESQFLNEEMKKAGNISEELSKKKRL